MNVAPAKPLVLTYGTLSQILLDLKPGEQFTYHIGMLLADREFPAADYQRVNDVGRAAYEAYERGQVLLVQHRLGENCYQYLAIGAKKPRRHLIKAPSLASL